MVVERNPPRRPQPLHQRTLSDNNTVKQSSFTSPRIIDDSQYYSTSPFPTQPSQVLSPQGFNAPAFVEEDYHEYVSEYVSEKRAKEFQVASSNETGAPTATSAALPHQSLLDLFQAPPTRNPERLTPKAKSTVRLVNAGTSSDRRVRLDPSQAAHHIRDFPYTAPHEPSDSTVSHSTRESTLCSPSNSTSTGPFSPYAPGFSGTTSPLSPSSLKEQFPAATSSILSRHKAEAASQTSGRTAQSPSYTRVAATPASSTKTTKATIPSTSSSTIPSASNSSRQTSSSTDAAKGVYYSAFPSSQTSLRRRSSSVTAPPPLKPILKNSSESLSSSGAHSQVSEARPSLSLRTVPSDGALEAAVASGATIQYPQVRPPSGQGSWADSSITIPKRLRMNEQPSPRHHQWKSALSTIPSESERNSQQTYLEYGSSGYVSPSITDTRNSGMACNMAGSFPGSPQTASHLPYAEAQREASNSTIRVVYEADEHGDGVRALRSPVYETSRHGRSRSELTRADSRSSGSVILSSIPAWARIYYGRGGRDSIGAPGSSTEGDDSRPSTSRSGNLPLGIFRTRPRNRNDSDMNITPLPDDVEVEITGPPRTRVTGGWSPRLHPDRRAKAVSIWQAPPLEGKESGGIFSRLNLQIILFCVGFIIPFAWMIAAVLPLPPNPNFTINRDSSNPDLEEAIVRNLASIDEARYEKARSWRNLNRIMSVIGLLIIGAIIALVVVALRMP